MAALFAGASTQYLSNSSPPIIDYPFSVGMWINLTAVGAVARTLFSLSDTATTNNYLLLRMTSAEVLQVTAAAGGTENNASSTLTITAGGWVFALGRFINSTNRIVAVMDMLGGVNTVNTTTARAPTGMDTMTIGALQTSGGVSEPWDGLIGEYWLANADCFPTDAITGTSGGVVRDLAHRGPFGFPNLAGKIIEYRSFREAPDDTRDDGSEAYYGAFGKQRWVNTNGVTIGHHPPLPYWYEKPGQNRRVLMV